MGLDPRILAQISNPTGGKLSQIGQTLAENRRYAEKSELERDKYDYEKLQDEAKAELASAKEERAVAEEQRKVDKRKEESESHKQTLQANLLEFDEDKRKDNYSDSVTLNSWIERFKVDAQNSEIGTNQQAYQEYLDTRLQGISDKDVLNTLRNSNPANFPLIQSNAKFAIDTYNQAQGDEEFSEYGKIAGTSLYGQRSSKTGKYSNIRDSIDGNTSLGSSEFERHLSYLKNNKLITKDKYDELIGQRAEGFAGEMKEGEKARLNEKQQDRYNRETKALREEYSKGSKHFKDMGESISGAMAAMDSGNTKLSEILLNQVMSQVQDTDVRAFAMYGEFDKEFGNLAERIQGKISRFFEGTRTNREAEEIRSVLNNFNNSYVQPAEAKLRNRYRELAIAQKKKPFEVVPPKNVDDIKSSKLLGKKEKIQMIKKMFPDWKP